MRDDAIDAPATHAALVTRLSTLFEYTLLSETLCICFCPFVYCLPRWGGVKGSRVLGKNPRDADAVAQIIHEANELNKSGPRPRVAAFPAAKWPNTYFLGPLKVA